MIATICLAVACWIVMVGSALAAAAWPQPPLSTPTTPGRHTGGQR